MSAVDTSSEEFRRECEAREVLGWEFSKRKPFLDMVEKARGREARRELEAEILKQYQASK